MSIAARNAILAGGAALPYDKRVEYIESTDCAAYFHLFDALPNISTTPNSYSPSWVDMWEVVVSVAQPVNTQKRFFGAENAFGVSTNNGYWSLTTLNNWPSTNIASSAYNPVMYRVETGKKQLLTADGSSTLWSRTGNIFVRFPDKTWGSARVPVGAFCYGSGSLAESQYRTTNRIYSFRRVLQNQPEFTLVPCVKDGVAGMYDEVSGTFCASTSGTPFVAGPDASAANGGGGYKRKCVRRSHTRSWRPSTRFYSPRLWKEVA